MNPGSLRTARALPIVAGLALALLAVAASAAGAASPGLDAYMRAMAAFRAGDDATARATARDACEQGEGRGCLVAGFLMKEGRGGPRDDAAARRLLWDACRSGQANGCFQHGILLRDGRGGAADAALARGAFARGCELGDAAACSDLGMLHETGQGGAADPATARHFYDLGCERGNVPGCFNLGRSYLNTAPQDRQQAVQAFSAACERDFGDGCYMLGLIRREAAEAAPARALFERACVLGSAAGCGLWGVALSDPGPGQDNAAALGAFRQGCEGGYPPACFNLGSFLRAGIGGSEGAAGARDAFTRACQLGHETACREISQ
ncbi:MAG: hypothetical protein GC187_04240 [Alphaproteobacteria bacterium]|nr:hypothetical protein [Alphaproteobacteria bacterium]